MQCVCLQWARIISTRNLWILKLLRVAVNVLPKQVMYGTSLGTNSLNGFPPSFPGLPFLQSRYMGVSNQLLSNKNTKSSVVKHLWVFWSIRYNSASIVSCDCFPASPQICRKSSLAPFITAGCGVNPGSFASLISEVSFKAAKD